MNPTYIRAGIALSVLLISLVAQDSLDHPPPADKIEVPQKGTTLPMGDIGGRPLVQVSVNGKGPYPFILDTGASVTVIDQGLKNELALHDRSGPPLLEPAGGPMARTVRIEELRVGDAVLKGVTASPSPLSSMFGMSDPPRGVLSAASFPGYLLILDYPSKKISIRAGQLSTPDSRRVFGYTSEHVLPNVPVTVAGTVIRAHVDSGSPASLTLPTKYLKELKFKSEPVETGKMRTHAGTFPLWTAKIDGGIELGEYQLDLANVNFSDVNPIPGEPTGNIGYQLLRSFVITMDAKNRRISFEK